MKKLFIKIKFIFKHGLSAFKNFLNKSVKPAIAVVSIVKDLVDNPLANVIVALTPVKWDDDAVKYGKQILPKVLLELQILDDVQSKTDSEILIAIISEVRNFTKNDKAKFYEDLTILLSKDLADGKLSAAELKELIDFVIANKNNVQ